MLKYEILEQAHQLPDGRKVYRIKAVRDFGNVKKGEIGGFVEADDNLSHDGLCWIANDAMALGRSRISGDALLRDRARIGDRVMLTDHCIVQDDARLSEFVFAYGHCTIGAQSMLAGAVTVRDHTLILCRPRYSVSGKKQVPNLRGNVMVRDEARLEGCISAQDDVTIAGRTTIRDHVRLLEKAYIGGESILEGRTTIGEEAKILQRAKIGGRTKIFGRVLIAGNVSILGKSYLTCNVYLFGCGTLRDVRLSGDVVKNIG